MTRVTPPEFVMPHDMASYDDEALEVFLGAMRERRLVAALHYEAAMAEKQAIADAKTRASFDKQLVLLAKGIVTLDAQMARVEARVNKVRALRLQLGTLPVDDGRETENDDDDTEDDSNEVA